MSRRPIPESIGDSGDEADTDHHRGLSRAALRWMTVFAPVGYLSARAAAGGGGVVRAMRSIRVLACLTRGAVNKEIAAALGISENTVKNHLKNIMEKLHLENRVQVVAYALREGLVRPRDVP